MAWVALCNIATWRKHGKDEANKFYYHLPCPGDGPCLEALL